MKMTVVLALGVAAAAVIAAVMRDPKPASQSAPSATAEQTPATAAAASASAPSDDTQLIEGKALEVIDVPSYTYIRVAQGNDSVWTAVSSAKVAVGQTVRIRSQTRMENFASSTLKRTFDSIYFGSIDDGTEGSPAVAPGAAQGTPTDNPHAMDGMSGHPHGTAAESNVPVGKVEKAPGPKGYRVAELFKQRKSLAGKVAHVRGVVVKATNGVMGKNFVHLRDGSGDAKAGNNDLTVTLDNPASVGDTILVEGKVGVDRDIGAGYRYDVLLEDAHKL